MKKAQVNLSGKRKEWGNFRLGRRGKYEGGGDSTDIPLDRVQKRDPFHRSFRGTAFEKGTDSTVHSMGPIVCTVSSSSSSSSCLPLLPFALREKRALGCAERRCRLCVCVLFWLIAIVSLASFVCANYVFEFPVRLRVFLLNRLFGPRWRGRTQRNWRWYSRCTFVSATVHSVLIYSRSLCDHEAFCYYEEEVSRHFFCRCAWLRRMKLSY